MPSAVHAERDHFELTDHGATHRGFVNSVVGQNIGLSLRRRGAVTAHRRENERLDSLRLSSNPP